MVSEYSRLPFKLKVFYSILVSISVIFHPFLAMNKRRCTKICNKDYDFHCVSGIIACEQALCSGMGMKISRGEGVPSLFLRFFNPFPKQRACSQATGIIAPKAGFLATKKRSTTVIARPHYKDMLLLNHNKVMQGLSQAAPLRQSRTAIGIVPLKNGQGDNYIISLLHSRF